FCGAVGIGMKLDIMQDPVRLEPLAQDIDERLVRRAAAAADAQLQRLRPSPPLQKNEGLDQPVQALLATHSRKVAQDGYCPLSVVRCPLPLLGGEWLRRGRTAAPLLGGAGGGFERAVALEIDPVVNNAHAIGGQIE